MYRFLGFIAVIVLLLAACRPIEYSQLQDCLLRPAVTTAAAQAASYVPGQLLVQYEPGIFTASAVQDAHQLTVLTAGHDGLPDLVSVTGDVQATATRLEADPRVKYAEPNWLLHTQQDCHSDNWHLVDAGAVPALDYGPGRHEVTVAVIDTGVDVDHEELAGAMLPGKNFHPDAADPDDPRPGTNAGAAHGTHVAGILVARGDHNALGVAGFPELIKVLPLRIFDDSIEPSAPMSALLDAIDFVSNPGGEPRADIINLSLGFAGSSTALDEAITRAHQAGILVVAAAGNNGNQVYAPANSEHAFAVGSVDHDYRRSAFSNYGGGWQLNVMAPGGLGPSICGTILSTMPDNAYGCLAGTSMSAPLVAGAAALLLTHSPRLSPDQLWNRLEAATYFDDGFMNTSQYGQGVLCVDRLLQNRNRQPGTACR